MSADKPSRRFLVAMLSGLAGVAVTGPLIYLELRTLPPIKPPPPPAVKQLSADEMAMIFEWCVVFFVVVYTVGEVIYRKIGATDDRRALKELSGAHLLLLESVGGAFLVSTPLIRANNPNPAAVWLLMAIGTVTMVHAGFQLIRKRRE